MDSELIRFPTDPLHLLGCRIGTLLCLQKSEIYQTKTIAQIYNQVNCVITTLFHANELSDRS